jgi:hypothetical protein
VNRITRAVTRVRQWLTRQIVGSDIFIANAHFDDGTLVMKAGQTLLLGYNVTIAARRPKAEDTPPRSGHHELVKAVEEAADFLEEHMIDHFLPKHRTGRLVRRLRSALSNMGEG